MSWSAGLLALVIPLAGAGVAAAASLSINPLKSASVNGRVRQVAYDGDILFLVGDFTQATDGSTVSRNHAAAIDTTTGHLLPWNPNVNGSVYSIAVDSTAGEVYLGGDFNSVGGVKVTKLAQVSASGTGAVSGSWQHPVSGVVYGLAISNEVLYLDGRFTAVGSVGRDNAAAIDLPTNVLDPTWQPAIDGGPAYSVAAVPGRVYLGTNATSIDGQSQFAKLAAVDPVSGSIDPTFNPKIPWVVYNLDVTSTTVYVAAGGPGGHLWSIALNGSINWLVTTDGDVQAVTDVGGLVVGGGHFDNVCSSPITGLKGACKGTQAERKKLFEVDGNGVLQSWAPDADSALGVFALRTDAAGDQIAAGGDFTAFHFKAVKQPHVALFGFS